VTDFFWPSTLIPNEVDWSLTDNVAVNTSPLTGATRTYARPGRRWSVRITLRSLQDARRHEALSLLAALRGRENRLLFTDITHFRRGAFPTSEALTNSAFESTSGWDTSNANLVISASGGLLRARRAGVSTDYTIRHTSAITTVSGAAYAFRVLALSGRGAMDYRLRLGTTLGGSETAQDSTDYTSEGWRTITALAGGTSTYASILDGIGSRSVGFYQEFSSPSFSRCARVNNTPNGGVAQTGSVIYIQNLPTSTDDLAIAGDLCEIGGELKRITRALNSDSSGEGTIHIEPAMRAGTVQNSPVIFSQPVGRFILSDETVGWTTYPGKRTDFQIMLTEALS
jgi:hypothetical protein